MKPRVPTIKSARVFAALPSGVLGAALVVRLFDEWWSYLPAGIVDDLHRDLHVDYAAAGWLLTLLWVGGFAGNGIGIVADHLSRRATAVTGALLLAAGLSVFALGAPYAGLALASVVMGAASDLIIRPIEAAIADEHGERLDRVLGWQHTLSWIGDLIGPLLLGLGAATSIGWRGAFAITAIAMALFAAHLATVRFPAPAAPAETRHSAPADIVAIARRRDVLQIAAAQLLLSPLDEPFLAFVVARAAAGSAAVGSRAAAQVLAAGVVVGGLAGSATVARRGLTSAVRRSGPTILFGGASLTPVTRSLVVQAAAMVLVGAGTACTWAAIHHRMLTIVPGRAATVSSVVGLLDTPALLVPVVVGVIADRAGLTAALTIYVALAGALVLLTATRRNERKRRRKAPGDRTARRLTRNGGDTGRVTAFDSSALDDAYIAFPPLELWRAARVNEALWFDTLQRLREAQSAVPPAAVADERDRSLRAAALNTGALEGLHNADRGLTFTVVNEAAWRETIDRVEGADARRFVEAAIDAFDLVLDVATGTHPLSEALIRELHSAVTAPQQTYVAQTQLGPQISRFPRASTRSSPTMSANPTGRGTPMHRWTE